MSNFCDTSRARKEKRERERERFEESGGGASWKNLDAGCERGIVNRETKRESTVILGGN